MDKKETKDQKLVRKWRTRIDKECAAHKKFRKQGRESQEAARADCEDEQYSIHWSNCKIIKSTIYANRPKPDVRRRYQKPDPDEKELARLVERALEYSLDTKGFEFPSHRVIEDFVKTGLGVPRVVYEVDTLPVESEMETDIDDETSEEREGGETLEEIVGQSVTIEHHPWELFHWEPGHTDWRNVSWVAYETFSTKKDIEDEYGVEVKAAKPDNDVKAREADKYTQDIRIFEIWDKPSRKVITICDGSTEPLEIRDDPLGLVGFFPSPCPAMDNLAPNELIPKPDYELVKGQIEALTKLVKKRDWLVQRIKAVRMYDASITESLEKLENGVDGANIPVVGMVEKLEGSDFTRMIAELPMTDRILVVREIQGQIDAVQQQVWEITGIADIQRGSSKASESATAQEIKGRWANVRLQDKTSEVNRLWRDVLRMMAEIMCEHFEPIQLQMMTGIEVTPRMVEIMQSDIGRTYAIDVETDSTVLKDDQEERRERIELLNVILEKTNQIAPGVQAGIIPAEFLQEALMFAVSTYKNGKQLEDSIMQLGPQLNGLQRLQQQMQQMGQQNQQMQGQLQQMQKAMQGFQQGKEQRETLLAQAKAAVDMADAEAQRIENRVVANRYFLEMDEIAADTEKTVAETDKIRAETGRVITAPFGVADGTA